MSRRPDLRLIHSAVAEHLMEGRGSAMIHADGLAPGQRIRVALTRDDIIERFGDLAEALTTRPAEGGNWLVLLLPPALAGIPQRELTSARDLGPQHHGAHTRIPLGNTMIDGTLTTATRKGSTVSITIRRRDQPTDQFITTHSWTYVQLNPEAT